MIPPCAVTTRPSLRLHPRIEPPGVPLPPCPALFLHFIRRGGVLREFLHDASAKGDVPEDPGILDPPSTSREPPIGHPRISQSIFPPGSCKGSRFLLE